MARPEIDTMSGVIYHGEDKAEKRYPRIDEITECPAFGGSKCRGQCGGCTYPLYGERGIYCSHPKSRKKLKRVKLVPLDWDPCDYPFDGEYCRPTGWAAVYEDGTRVVEYKNSAGKYFYGGYEA